MSCYLSCLAASGFADEDEGPVVAEGAEELVLVPPHGELAALLESQRLIEGDGALRVGDSVAGVNQPHAAHSMTNSGGPENTKGPLSRALG